jgi:2-methylcitrate dehydratase
MFTDGTSTEKVVIEYPLGHRRRRDEAKPALVEKFRSNAATRFDDTKVQRLIELFSDQSAFETMAVDELMDLLVPSGTRG